MSVDCHATYPSTTPIPHTFTCLKMLKIAIEELIKTTQQYLTKRDR